MGKPTLGTKVVKVVKVVRCLGKGSELPALVYAKGGRYQKHQHLSPEILGKLGGDLFAYFEAELLRDTWWIGDRLPDGNRGW